MPDHTIRKARVSDAKAIHGLINANAKKELLLPRPYNQIFSCLRDFYVAEDSSGQVVGCCALTISWEDLGEIRSLVVADSARGKGLGSVLVRSCLEEAGEIGLKRIFTLTYVTRFFASLGFSEVNKDILPQKIWTDCLNCPRFPECDETAMMLRLEGAEEAGEAA